jgi:hypothetical protein
MGTLAEDYGVEFDWSGTYSDGDGSSAVPDGYGSGGIGLNEDGNAEADPTTEVDFGGTPSDQPDATEEEYGDAVADQEDRQSDAWQDVVNTDGNGAVGPETGEDVALTDEGEVVGESGPLDEAMNSAEEAVNEASEAVEDTTEGGAVAWLTENPVIAAAALGAVLYAGGVI